MWGYNVVELVTHSAVVLCGVTPQTPLPLLCSLKGTLSFQTGTESSSAPESTTTEVLGQNPVLMISTVMGLVKSCSTGITRASLSPMARNKDGPVGRGEVEQ